MHRSPTLPSASIQDRFVHHTAIDITSPTLLRKDKRRVGAAQTQMKGEERGDTWVVTNTEKKIKDRKKSENGDDLHSVVIRTHVSTNNEQRTAPVTVSTSDHHPSTYVQVLHHHSKAITRNIQKPTTSKSPMKANTPPPARRNQRKQEDLFLGDTLSFGGGCTLSCRDGWFCIGSSRSGC